MELLRSLHNRSGASLERTRVYGIRIMHVEVNSTWHRLPLASRIAHHDDRVADPDLGMPDSAVRLRYAFSLLCLEGLLQEIDQFGCPLNGQIRRDGVIARRNGFDCHGSCLLCTN